MTNVYLLESSDPEKIKLAVDGVLKCYDMKASGQKHLTKELAYRLLLIVCMELQVKLDINEINTAVASIMQQMNHTALFTTGHHMTVGDLVKRLQDMPEDMPIVMQVPLQPRDFSNSREFEWESQRIGENDEVDPSIPTKRIKGKRYAMSYIDCAQVFSAYVAKDKDGNSALVFHYDY